MGVHDVEAAPVPRLQVDRPRPVLVVPGDHEPAARGHEPRRRVERSLRPRRLEHAFATLPVRVDGGVAPHLHDLRAGRSRELDEERAEEADPDHGDRLPGAHVATPEDVHGARERLAGERRPLELGRQLDDVLRRSDVVPCEGAVRQRRHPPSEEPLVDARTHGRDAAPALVARRPRLEGVLEPRPPLPDRHVRAADAAALQPQQHLARAGLRHRGRPHLDPSRGGDDGAPGEGRGRRHRPRRHRAYRATACSAGAAGARVDPSHRYSVSTPSRQPTCGAQSSAAASRTVSAT